MKILLTVFVLFDNYTECVHERTVTLDMIENHFNVLITRYGTTCKIVARPI